MITGPCLSKSPLISNVFRFSPFCIKSPRLGARDEYDTGVPCGKIYDLRLQIVMPSKAVHSEYLVCSPQSNYNLNPLVQKLDEYCEDLLEKVFGEAVNFEVSDALRKLEYLKLVSKVSSCEPTWSIAGTSDWGKARKHQECCESTVLCTL